MNDQIKWHVILACPGEEELSLLAELSARPDANIVAICDPDPKAMGVGLAEIMGIPVISSLADLPNKDAEFLVHPPFNDAIAAIADTAHNYSLQLVPAQAFPAFMAKASMPEAAAPFDPSTVDEILGEQDFDFLEMETATIHRTLSRIEEALDREALLRWLLGLAIRATGAGSGSVMLFDKASDELYVAYGDGLSESTKHRTRVRLGEGIAGKVAATGKAEIITDNRHPGIRRDRPDVNSAICAPISWEGKLLGVLNVSSTSDNNRLSVKALTIIESLTHRFGMILDRFLRIQTMHDGQVFKELEEALSFNHSLGSMDKTLDSWAKELAKVSGAEDVVLYLLTSGGDLLTSNGDGCRYIIPEASMVKVMATGNPLVLRPGDTNLPDDCATNTTIFHLPLTGPSAQAMVTLQFKSASSAHHFHTISVELLFLLGRHLAEARDRADSADQVDRLTVLAGSLSELAASEEDLGSRRERILAAACQLTGAGQAWLLEDSHQVQGSNQALMVAIAQQLVNTKGQGWKATFLNPDASSIDGEHGRPLLLVPGTNGSPFPGLALLDKERLHPLDGTNFTEFDALFARRLLPVLENLTQKPDSRPILATLVETSSSDNEPFDIPALEETPAKGNWDDIVPPPLATPETGDLRKNLLVVLGREMNRCDRYHNMLGLVAFRLNPDNTPPTVFSQLHELIYELGRKLRGSDHCAYLSGGIIVVIVPEDVQSIPRMQNRVTNLLTELSEHPELEMTTSSKVYPGVGDSPDDLLDAVLKSLP
jgi:hypothetical protein